MTSPLDLRSPFPCAECRLIAYNQMKAQGVSGIFQVNHQQCQTEIEIRLMRAGGDIQKVE